MPGNEDRCNRQLGGGERKRFASQGFFDAVHFVEHLARLNLGHVILRIALAVTHPDFSRFLRNRLVREDPDPDATASFDMTGHGSASRFDLARGKAAASDGLQAELTE